MKGKEMKKIEKISRNLFIGHFYSIGIYVTKTNY